MPKFSIVIANYNNGKYINDCYNSILSQTFKDWEVIIVDDCSTDDSVNIILRLICDDPRVKLYQNTTNSGVGYTKARGVNCAQGDYVGVLDPDDALHADALNTINDTFEANAGIVGVCTKSILCDQRLQFKSNIPYRYETFVNEPLSYLSNGLDTIHHFFVFKRDAYLKTPGIDPTLRNGDDIDLYIKLDECGSIYCLNQYLHFYRTSPDGLTKSSTSARSWYWVLLVLMRNGARRMREHKMTRDYYGRLILERLIFILREAREFNDKETFR